MSKSALFTNIKLLPNEEIIWESAPDKKSVWPTLFSGIFIYLFIGCFLLMFPILITMPSEKTIHERAEKATNEYNSHTFDTLYYDSVKADLKSRESELPPEYRDTLFNFSTVEHIFFSLFLILLWFLLKFFISFLSFKSRWFMVTTERVMIQSGITEKRVSIIDIDKINSIQTFQGTIDQRLGLCNIELVLAGVLINQNSGVNSFLSKNVIVGMKCDSPVLDKLINSWLIRDNK